MTVTVETSGSVRALRRESSRVLVDANRIAHQAALTRPEFARSRRCLRLGVFVNDTQLGARHWVGCIGRTECHAAPIAIGQKSAIRWLE